MGNKILIALFGSKDSGKTTALNKMIDKLDENYAVEDTEEGALLRKDRLVTVNINGVIVGISTGGDSPKIVESRINILLAKKCSIIVTATRTRGIVTNVLVEFKNQNDYKLERIKKSVTSSKVINKEELESLNEKHNNADMEKILQTIFHYIN